MMIDQFSKVIMPSSLDKIELALRETRDSLYAVCSRLGLDMPDRDELTIEQCTHCSTWKWTHKLQEDLDGNLICRYCEELIGM